MKGLKVKIFGKREIFDLFDAVFKPDGARPFFVGRKLKSKNVRFAVL
jgi:hypothetical protein